MVKIAVVEDEAVYIRQLNEFLDRFNGEHDDEITFDIFTDGAMLVERYSKDYNIIIMDIDMPILNGMEAAAEIRKVDDEVIIMFITNVAQYAIKGYSVGALDYVLKPIDYFAFSQCLIKAIARAKKAAVKYITLRVNRGIQKLNVAEIKYVECRNHTLIYHTLAGEITVTGTLKNAEQDLGDAKFAKCHSSYLVNFSHVDTIRDGCIIVKGEEVPLSRSRKESFKKGFMCYINEVTK